MLGVGIFIAGITFIVIIGLFNGDVSIMNVGKRDKGINPGRPDFYDQMDPKKVETVKVKRKKVKRSKKDRDMFISDNNDFEI